MNDRSLRRQEGLSATRKRSGVHLMKARLFSVFVAVATLVMAIFVLGAPFKL
ncbi:MAG: hypothetical protein ACR2MA_13255 [Egibacteraceae bacterium]